MSDNAPRDRSRIYIDRRLGNLERWSLGPLVDMAMRIPDELLKAVCFLGIREPDSSTHWGGTAFSISAPLEDFPERDVGYLVTARHNVDLAAEEIAKSGGYLCLRINTVGGGTTVVNLTPAKWLLPDNPGVDVAAFRWTPPDSLDYLTIPRQIAVTPEIIDTEGVGLGDELIMVGLFVRREGHERNEPIVRSGVISAEPSEPLVNALTGADMHGCYLAELRSIAGLSGSPVYVFLPPGRVLWETNRGGISRDAKFFLLGLIHGHWPLDKSRFIATDFGDGEEPLNTGIAIVSPITDALKLIDSPGEIDYRRQFAAELRAREAPVLD